MTANSVSDLKSHLNHKWLKSRKSPEESPCRKYISDFISQWEARKLGPSLGSMSLRLLIGSVQVGIVTTIPQIPALVHKKEKIHSFLCQIRSIHFFYTTRKAKIHANQGCYNF